MMAANINIVINYINHYNLGITATCHLVINIGYTHSYFYMNILNTFNGSIQLLHHCKQANISDISVEKNSTSAMSFF